MSGLGGGQVSGEVSMDLVLPIGSLVAMIITASTLSWWLSSRFTEMRKEIYMQLKDMQDRILSKMEYHERHDDQRFGAILNDLWAIRVRNAARDGVINGHTPFAPKKEAGDQ